MHQNVIGVDVSKSWIDTFSLDTHKSGRISMTPKTLKAFAERNKGSLVVLEASGGYERPLLQALASAEVIYSRVNPRHAREFARATGRLAKTDKYDAAMLAEMGRALNLKPTPPPDPARERLSTLMARRDQLVEQKMGEECRKKQAFDAFVSKSILRHISALKREIEKLETEIAKQIASNSQLSLAEKRLRSAPGVGPIIAASLIGRLPELGQVSNKAIASLVGLAPHACESGQMRGRRMIWGGRKDVRKSMFQAAKTAIRCNPAMKARYQKLIDAGKPKKVAVIAVARVFLTQLNAIMREERNYRKN
jgi:transposase